MDDGSRFFSILYEPTFKNDPFGVQGLWWKGHGLTKWLEHLVGKGYKVVYSNRVGGPTQDAVGFSGPSIQSRDWLAY